MPDKEKKEKESKEAAEKKLDKSMPCEVMIMMDDQIAGGSSLHFNERGMLINCENPVPLNTKLQLVLQFPGFRNPIELQAEVVWTNIHGPDDTMTPRGMGVKFLNLEREVERLLADLAGQYDAFGSMYSCYYS